jgi:predicted regulator of Ras-like GTPase activity (Roadblock/LC7/MglB family)
VKDLDEILTHLVENVGGASGAFVGSSDGLLIEQYSLQGQDFSAVAAQWTNVLVALGNVAGSLKAGVLSEAMVTAENMVAYVRLINEEMFCAIIMNPSGDIDKARMLSGQVSQSLLEVFA